MFGHRIEMLQMGRKIHMDALLAKNYFLVFVFLLKARKSTGQSTVQLEGHLNQNLFIYIHMLCTLMSQMERIGFT